MTPRGARTTPGGPAQGLRHWNKALRFRDAAEANARAGLWDGAVSNAILAAIQAASAATIHFSSHRSSSQNHEDAIFLLEQATALDAGVRARFLLHFQALLSLKSLVQYSDRAYEPAEGERAIQHLERALASLAGLAKTAGWPAP